jgi:hypothetical protein
VAREQHALRAQHEKGEEDEAAVPKGALEEGADEEREQERELEPEREPLPPCFFWRGCVSGRRKRVAVRVKRHVSVCDRLPASDCP